VRASSGKMSADKINGVLEAIKAVQDVIEEEKQHLNDGLYVRLCDAMQGVYNHAHALKPGGDGSEEDDNGDEGEGESDEESDEEPRERTEDDMGVNELSELWEWQFDFGHPQAVMELDFLIDEITASITAKRVCAAVRVLNRALKGSKPDDPADAERILRWKEELVAERAIRVCAEILERVDGRGFHNESDEEYWLYSSICDEILELFQRLGENDALFRTKLRRNGGLKGVQAYHARGRDHLTKDVLNMLQQR